jgi:hypothetical protein
MEGEPMYSNLYVLHWLAFLLLVAGSWVLLGSHYQTSQDEGYQYVGFCDWLLEHPFDLVTAVIMTVVGISCMVIH